MKTWPGKLVPLFALVLLAAGAHAASGHNLGTVLAKVPGTAGFSAAIVDGRAPVQTFVQGDAAPGKAMERTTSFRIASNTKVYTAVVVLRLWEDGRLQLDDSIRKHVDPAYIALLEKDGYDTARITVRHLLSHTSGMADHAQTREYLDVIEKEQDRSWTRTGQLEWLVRWTDPLGKPGEKFAYSDSGYCLLGNIIERLTGQPLAQVVRSTIGYDRLGLNGTYWETQEPQAAQAGPRAHVYIDGKDVHGWHPTLDMYGGGGLVATPEDMARFLLHLFEGKIFKRHETLQAMISKEGLPADSPYRLGIFEYDAGGAKAYGHTGFWGTGAIYLPAERRAVAFAVTNRDTFKPAFEAVKAYAGAH